MDQKKQAVGYKCPTLVACKHLWKCAVEQQYFYTYFTQSFLFYQPAAVCFVMVALCNRVDHYIFFPVISIFVFFSSPDLSSRRLDVYHTSTHDVALVRI